MVRVKRGAVARKRRKKLLKLAKGFQGSQSKLYRTANQRVMRALTYSYIGRKQKKRLFRRLWIVRINAAVRDHGLNYSSFISLLKLNKIALNRKMLSQLAILDQPSFMKIIEKIKNE